MGLIKETYEKDAGDEGTNVERRCRRNSDFRHSLFREGRSHLMYSHLWILIFISLILATLLGIQFLNY